MSVGQDIPATGRVLAVDLGDVRVGLAATDPDQTIASPDETVPVASLDDLDAVAAAVGDAAEERRAVGLVVGYPRNLDGREGPNASRARRIAERVGERTGLPVRLWDERLSSIEAERAMLGQDASRGERRRSLDRVAASVILQGWLEARRRGNA